MSDTDHLTKISNRLKFSTDAGREVNSSKRYNYPLAILMFDFDHFKKVNDTFGYDIGDVVLVGTARIVEELIRETIVFTRLKRGGRNRVVVL
jgi:diguanylate cyclase (GGDEF)-like protein